MNILAKWIQPLPRVCTICEAELGPLGEFVQSFVGREWTVLCRACWSRLNIGGGPGFAHLYRRQADGDEYVEVFDFATSPPPESHGQTRCSFARGVALRGRPLTDSRIRELELSGHYGPERAALARWHKEKGHRQSARRLLSYDAKAEAAFQAALRESETTKETTQTTTTP